MAGYVPSIHDQAGFIAPIAAAFPPPIDGLLDDASRTHMLEDLPEADGVEDLDCEFFCGQPNNCVCE